MQNDDMSVVNDHDDPSPPPKRRTPDKQSAAEAAILAVTGLSISLDVAVDLPDLSYAGDPDE